MRIGAGLSFVLAACALAACAAEPPPPPLADVGLRRARLTACLGISLPVAVGLLGPESLGGLSAPTGVCVEQAPDCEAVLDCLWPARRPCAGDGPRCDGTAAVNCLALSSGPSIEVVEDCAASVDGNTRCAVLDEGKGTFAACHAGPCGSGDLPERCEGEVVVRCFAGVAVREDCRASLRTCAAGLSGAFCALEERCERDRCEGDVAVVCRDGLVDVRQDCRAVVSGGTCRDLGGAVDCAAAPWHPVCPEDEPFTSWCDGDTALACFAGALLEADCPSLTGGTCAAAGRGPDVGCVDESALRLSPLTGRGRRPKAGG